MSSSRKNAITYGMSGKFGEQFVLRDGVLCEMPKKRKDAKSQKQLKNRDKFLEAISYAQAVMEVPEKKEAYKAVAGKKQSAYNMAMKDAYNPPRIVKIKTETYTGAIGSLISVLAIDDFNVNTVKVSIYNAAGELVEEGFAAMETGLPDWRYVVTQSNQSPSGGKVIVRATDDPGNVTEMEQLL